MGADATTGTKVEEMREALRAKIAAKQGEGDQRQTDTAFAQPLKISRAEWHKIRTGERKELSTFFLRRVMKVFPDLTMDVMSYMAAGDEQE